MAESAADPRIGTVIDDRYRIIDKIASGGMGVVYRAERLQLGRTVAVKFLDAANAADENSLARFEREARAMSLLSHPHCVSVIDFGVSGTPFIVMDYVTGQPLVSLIRTKKKVEAERSVNIMKQVMAALAHAHGHNVIHRDIKPANIMLTEATGSGDFVRILDFGLAKLRGASSLSSANIVVGTPSYMSPEQGAGTNLDARSDVYSAGIVLFELLTGEKPFAGESAFEILKMHQKDAVPLLGTIRGSDEIRIALDAVIQQALAKKPKNRFQTALAMGEALGRIKESSRQKRPRGKSTGRVRDPARATTQLPEVAKEAEGTEILSNADSSAETKSGWGRFFRSILILGVMAAIGFFGWRYWTSLQAENDPKMSRGVEPSLTVIVSSDARIADAQLAQADAQVADADVTDAQVTDAQVTDAQVSDAQVTDAQVSDAQVADAQVADAQVADNVAVNPDENDDGNSTSVTPGAAPSGPPKSGKEARAIYASGDKSRAIRGLAALLKASPKDPYLLRTMGDFNVDRGWWSESIKNYTAAVRLSPRYKTFKSINDNAIAALRLGKVRRRAERFIRTELGRSALVHLRAAVRDSSSPTVRKRAAALIKQIE